eukprot:TRINITY_DN59466_c0_g1_i1.p1 TRINITY_DN59466_c0_g1~~TRINITY_DN59466_c0_g1_i1.p1  ORF type:complete len:943 (-),score=142.02 TRINITY_DN59466_c0_g1_i1:914-3370(-)
MADFLADPLTRALRDTDPYVRKTAAMAVAKMFSINRDRVEESHFLTLLLDLLVDSNPTVVSNAVASLCEIRELAGATPLQGATATNDLEEFKPQTVHTLLNALTEASEWGQVYLLEGLSSYTAKAFDEAEMICERIMPRLQHSNSAVVLAAIRILVQFLEVWVPKLPADQQEEQLRKIHSKMGPPLISLISGNQECEIRYVALRNITLIVRRFPTLLQSQIKVFFVKYNDPIFIKLEKLDIMLLLVDGATVDLCLSEFREYAQEIDVEFVRKSVRAIGRTAVKIETATQKCIDVLLALIKTRVNYVVQEAIIVIKDIFRKYPNQYESIIGALCENLDTLDEPDAKASMIWIIGEYAERIENADELLEMFIDTFEDETPQVKLSILTGMVKLFLKRPSDTQELLQRVLKLASDADIPDLRDRGYIYWRLLSSDPEAAKEVVLNEKPVIDDGTTRAEKELVQELLPHIANLASVYHKPPSSFLADYLVREKKVVYMEDEEDEVPEEEAQDTTETTTQQQSGNEPNLMDAMDFEAPAHTVEGSLGLGLDSFLSTTPTPAQGQSQPQQQAAPQAAEPFDDFFGGPAPAAAPQAPQLDYKTILTADKGFGCQCDSVLVEKSGSVVMELRFTNKGTQSLLGFTMQINKNVFGVASAAKLTVPEPLMPGQSATFSMLISFLGQAGTATNLQIALKTNAGVAYFQDDFPLQFFVDKSVTVDKQEFRTQWQAITEETSAGVTTFTPNQAALQQKLEAAGIGFIAKVSQGPNDRLYFAFKARNGSLVLVELSIPQGGNSTNATVSFRTDNPGIRPPLQQFLNSLLTSA